MTIPATCPHECPSPAACREAVLAEHIPCLMCRRATEMLDEQQTRRADATRSSR